MSTTPVARKTLGDLVETRLKLLTGITVYRGEVPEKPPVIKVDGVPDPSGRVAPYVVLFAGPGDPTIDPDVADQNIDLDWSFQTTIAAGYEPDCGHAVDRVFNQLHRWTPAQTGYVLGRVKQQPGFDPGPIRPDKDKTPIRFWLPLQWRLPVTTT